MLYNRTLKAEGFMNKEELIKRIALLESTNDQMYAEIIDIDRLMRLVGFDGGLETVKLTAEEIYNSEHLDHLDEDEAA